MKIRGLKAIIIVGTLATLALVGWALVQNSWGDSWRDSSFITGVPCAPPCWQGIVPGLTSKTEALDILENNPYVKIGSIEVAGTTELGGCLWEYRTQGKRIQPGMSWQNGVVDTITLGLNIDLNVSKMIEVFGHPEAVEAIPGGIPEHWYWIIHFYYPSKGIELKAFTSEFENRIEPSTEIGIISLFSPLSLDERVDELEKEFAYPLPEDYLTQWKGYGNVAEMYAWNQD